MCVVGTIETICVCRRDYRDYYTGGGIHEGQESTSHMCVIGAVGTVKQKYSV